MDRDTTAGSMDALVDDDLSPNSMPLIGITLRARHGRDVELLAADAFDAHAAALKGFAAVAVRDSDAADDLVQETFLRLVGELRSGRQPDNVRAWLFRVCANLIVSQGRRRVVSDRARHLLVERWSAPSPEESAIRRHEDDDLKRGLERLRREERVALLLSASGLSAAEVGVAIGRTPNATRAFLCRSRLELRRILSNDEVGR